MLVHPMYMEDYDFRVESAGTGPRRRGTHVPDAPRRPRRCGTHVPGAPRRPRRCGTHVPDAPRRPRRCGISAGAPPMGRRGRAANLWHSRRAKPAHPSRDCRFSPKRPLDTAPEKTGPTRGERVSGVSLQDLVRSPRVAAFFSRRIEGRSCLSTVPRGREGIGGTHLSASPPRSLAVGQAAGPAAGISSFWRPTAHSAAIFAARLSEITSQRK